MSKVFVAGATGTAGRAYATAFAAAGHRVRASVRPGTQHSFGEGVEACFVDFDDTESTRVAVSGADAVIIALAGRGPSPAQHEASITLNVARAAAEEGVEHLTYTSVHRADEATGVPHFEVKGKLERQLSELAPRVTILRPTTFAESLTAPWLRTGIQQRGVLTSPIGQHTPISYVATADLARIAVAALSTPALQGAPVVAAGESPTSYADLLPLFSELASRPVGYQQIPLEEVQRTFGPDLAAMTELFNRAGFTAQPSPVLCDLGLAPGSVQEYLRRSWMPDFTRLDVAAIDSPQEQ